MDTTKATTIMPDADFDKVAVLGDALLLQINAMREVAPIIWSENAGAWIVTRHEDLVEAYSGKLPLTNVRYYPPYSNFTDAEREARFPETMRTIGYWPVFTDPPLHTRLRKLLTRAFGRKTVEDVRPVVRRNIEKILSIAGAQGEVEFVNEVARAVTARSILYLLGMNEDSIGRLEHWSLVVNTALGSGAGARGELLDDLEKVVVEMRALFEAELSRKRATPGEDFISQMLAARDGTDKLTDDEIIGVCFTVLIAGHDTTMNSMGLATIALAQYPDAVEYMLAHPGSITNSVMEVSRYIAMSTMQPRVVSEDFEWHGEHLKKNEYMFLMIAGANRDPRVFENPEALNLARNADRVLVFGSGIHHCIGHLLAKMQLSEFLPELFRRFHVEIRSVLFSPVLSQRGPASLMVRLEPRIDGASTSAESH